MRAWPVARSIFDAPLGEKSYVREANERTTSWINQRSDVYYSLKFTIFGVSMLPNANVVKPFSPAGLQAPATAKRQPSGAPTTRCVASRGVKRQNQNKSLLFSKYFPK